jgi:hypothetical protein
VIIRHVWSRNWNVIMYLLHRYSVTANQVMVATVTLSKWWL